jgi:predicted nucleic acid-binding protein
MILIDTGPLVALVDAKDGKHKTARRHLKALWGGRFCVCEPVLVEACFHLPHRPARQRLRGLLDEIGTAPVMGPGDSGLWSDVFEWLLKYSDQEPDWADGCIAVLSGRDTALTVWTYDREFRTTWRRPDGTRIPLAV